MRYFTRSTPNNEQRKVSKEKLVQLWFSKRKKAIEVIKNSGFWPIRVCVSISVQRNENYYNTSPKLVIEDNFEPENERHFDRLAVRIDHNDFFKYDEIEAIIKKCPVGKRCGQDGVSYEDIKEMWEDRGNIFLDILNTILINQRIPSSWKHCLVLRTPKKNYSLDDLSTLRDISLLPTCYKIFSKALCGRIIPYFENQIMFWQRAFMRKRDRQELIFSLKTAIDDFRHLSTKFHIVFVDFADAFGSVNHKFILETLVQYGIPLQYCCLIEDLYKYSSFSVICGESLSKLFYIIRGTKTGDPLSGALFILVIDRVCRPMFTHALINLNIEDEMKLNPLPVQAFADDIAAISFIKTTVQGMLDAGEPEMAAAELEGKPSKCAVFYDRRSGNNWYKGKNDEVPTITLQGNALTVMSRNTPYKYLGKSMSISGEDPKQIIEMIETYEDIICKISECELPIVLKASAFNNVALAKVLHHFYNSRLTEEQINHMDSALTKTVRKLFELYSSTTQLVIYLPREDGGIGVKRISDVYYTTRIAFLVKMLNHPIEQFQNIARESLKRDMEKRNVYQTGNENNFLGYELNENGFLKTHTKFGCASDWPDLLRYTRKVGVSLIFVDDKATVRINDKYYNDTKNLQKILFRHTIQSSRTRSSELSIQGAFFNIPHIQLKASHSFMYNHNISDTLVKFTLKARLSLLPTNFTLHLWDRDKCPLCPFCQRKTESIAHLFNGCQQFHNFYSRRHNRIAEKIEGIICEFHRRERVYANRLMETIMPDLQQQLSTVVHRKPDIVIFDAIARTCIIIEITICFDMYFEYAFTAKNNRYKQLCDVLQANGINVELIVLCFGSLGCIRKDVWKSLRRLKIDKDVIKDCLQWCSISNIIGANYVWRHRVKKLFS